MSQDVPAAELRVAKKFRLTRKIGQGSFGDIFLGRMESSTLANSASTFAEHSHEAKIGRRSRRDRRGGCYKTRVSTQSTSSAVI